MTAATELWTSICVAPDERTRLEVVAWAERARMFFERATMAYNTETGFSFTLCDGETSHDLFFYYGEWPLEPDLRLPQDDEPRIFCSDCGELHFRPDDCPHYHECDDPDCPTCNPCSCDDEDCSQCHPYDERDAS